MPPEDLMEINEAVAQGDVERIGLAIRQRLGGRVRDLVLRHAENCLELHGRVATYHAKQLAQAVALEAAGCLRIVNLIHVRRHSARFVDQRPLQPLSEQYFPPRIA